MSGATTKTVKLRIYGREESINCAEEEVSELVRAAEILDAEMNNTGKQSRQSVPYDRVCLLSSLNLIDRLLASERLVEELTGHINALLEMKPRISDALRPPDARSDSEDTKSSA